MFQSPVMTARMFASRVSSGTTTVPGIPMW